MSLWKGYDFKTTPPGTVESTNCTCCGEVMTVERNRSGPTSFAGSMGRCNTLHDRFTCPNAGTDWHSQVVQLMMKAQDTPSGTLEKMYRDEIAQILKDRKPTKALQ